jgi:membrane-bound lytic murein transglycosylase B
MIYRSLIIIGLFFFGFYIPSYGQTANHKHVVHPLQNNFFVQRTDVKKYLDHLVTNYHFSKPKLLKLFSQIKLRHSALHAVKRPYNRRVSWHEYQKHLVSIERIKSGQDYMQKHQKYLQKAELKFGVPQEVIVAIIGIESDYGKRMGDYRVIDALSSIAFGYHKRGRFFKSELTNFLLFCRDNKIDPLSVYGSYAGAMGQMQFMPSNIRRYALDFDHSGRIDLEHDAADVIGSVANFLMHHGWKPNAKVAVRLGLGHLADILAVLKQNLLVQNQLPDFNIFKHSIKLEGEYGLECWIGLQNMWPIRHYNTAIYYVMSVRKLSKMIAKSNNALENR